jgi:hypothetical protein
LQGLDLFGFLNRSSLSAYSHYLGPNFDYLLFAEHCESDSLESLSFSDFTSLVEWMNPMICFVPKQSAAILFAEYIEQILNAFPQSNLVFHP